MTRALARWLLISMSVCCALPATADRSGAAAGEAIRAPTDGAARVAAVLAERAPAP